MIKPKNSHCSHCGAAFAGTSAYPRACPNSDCGALTWANPAPVAVTLVPITDGDQTGLLAIRRAIEPGLGKLALVGGFVDAGEDWRDAAAREVFEESQVRVEAATLEPLWFASTEPRPDRVLLFATAGAIAASDLPRFEATSETSERRIVFATDPLEELFAFPLHAEAARRYFASRS